MTRAMDHWLRGTKTAFCPGCGHGILMHAILRACDSLDLDRKNLLFVSGIGCAAWIPSPNIASDTLHTLHGRAVAYATGAKLANPKLKVIVVSGDGDLTSIGGNHLIHAARRDVDLTVICANNEIYGMTGGQTASTTPVGCYTATDPEGSKYRPFDVCKLVRAAGAGFTARWPVTQPGPLSESVKQAMAYEGFSFVEAISPCPTQFGRRNSFDDIGALYDDLANMCVTKEQARTMTRAELQDHFVVGQWSEDD